MWVLLNQLPGPLQSLGPGMMPPAPWWVPPDSIMHRAALRGRPGPRACDQDRRLSGKTQGTDRLVWDPRVPLSREVSIEPK